MNANALNQISAYKNPLIVERLSRTNNLDPSEAELLFEDTKNIFISAPSIQEK